MPVKQISTLLLASCLALGNAVTAMVINAPQPQTFQNPAISSSTRTNPIAPPHLRPSTTQKRFRIRHTHASDLDAISTMLAEASVPSSGTYNWNDSVKRLRAKPLLEKQIAHRLDAVEEGRNTINMLKQQLEYEQECSLSDDDTCHFLWSNDTFRGKLRNAILNSQEQNAWTSHNFDVTPSSEMLTHVMMSVEELYSGEIVGFCEVAWLPSPISCNFDDTALQRNFEDATRIQVSEDSLDIPQSYCEGTDESYCDMSSHSYNNEVPIQCAPAIVNLVTSQSHRRMGIASRVLKFASKYTKTQWNCDDTSSSAARLGLYVRSYNESALRLYSNKGFSIVSSECEDGLLYMTQ